MSFGICAACEITSTTSGAGDLPAAVDLGAHRRGVEPADHLVRQVQMTLVARRHLERRLDRIVQQAHRVVALEARPDVVENAARFLDASARRTCTVRKRRASASSSWMYSLCSLSVVAPIMRTSPRASTDLNTLAASDGAPSAEPAPTIVCASSTNRIRFGRSLISRMTFWIRSSNIPRSIVPATIVFICRLIDLAVAKPHGHGVRLELDAARETLDDRGLADAGLADEHHRVGALAVTEDLEHLLDFLVAAVDGRDLVLPRQQIQVRRKVLEERRQLEPLPQPLFAEFVVPHPGGNSRHKDLRLDAMAANDRDRNALALLEDG